MLWQLGLLPNFMAIMAIILWQLWQLWQLGLLPSAASLSHWAPGQLWQLGLLPSTIAMTDTMAMMTTILWQLWQSYGNYGNLIVAITAIRTFTVCCFFVSVGTRAQLSPSILCGIVD